MIRIPSYRLHKPSGQAVVTLNRRDYYLGAHGSKESKAEHKRLIAEYLAGSPATFGVSQDLLTVIELATAYKNWCKKYYGTGHAAETSKILLALKPLRTLYGRSKAVNFGPLQFKAVRENLVNEVNPKRKKPRTRQYVNSAMKRIVRMFKWGASEGMLPASVYETLRLIPGLKRGRTDALEAEPVRPVDEAVLEATLKQLPSVLADMVRVQRLTGMRPGELCTLTPGMIDRSGDVWQATLKEHKTAYRGRERTVYFGPQCQAILKPYLLRGPGDCLFRPVDSERKRRAAQHEARRTPPSCGNVPGSKPTHRRYELTASLSQSALPCICSNAPNWIVASVKLESDSGLLRHLNPINIRKRNANTAPGYSGTSNARTR